MSKKESKFQAKLIEELREMFPGCLILKNDEQYIQGIPDLTILHKKKWAMLECKKAADASRRPNQEYYVKKADAMSFARFIEPSNREEVLGELQQTFRTGRNSRILKCE